MCVCVCVCVELLPGDLNPGPYHPHPTSTYICRVPIALRVCGVEKKRSWVECVTIFLAVFGFIACCFVWFNNTIYPNVYRPTRPEVVELEGSFRKESIYELISIIGSQDI